MLKIKPILALICAKTRKLTPLSSLMDVERCSARTKKCRVRDGMVVKVTPSGVTRAWPQMTLLSGLRSHVAMKVRSIHLAAP
jgi:hypothetical protein